MQQQFGPSRRIGAAELELENARFMGRVYAWMSFGVLLTALVGWQVSQDPETLRSMVGGFFWVVMLLQFGAVIALSAFIEKMNPLVASLVYLLYAALTGLTFSFIFIVYTQSSVAQVFGVTAFSFAGLSVFGLTTKRDLGPLGSFCIMGLFGIVGVSILSIFFPSMNSGAFGFVTNIAGIVVFAGLTAYDTQRIKAMNAATNYGDEGARRKMAIHGALILYLDFINLFLQLLRLMGRRRD